MEDSQIIELYWRRDEAAVSATAEKYGSFCYGLAKNILTSHEDAEECVSDTYRRAWDSMPPLRPTSLRAWLGRVVRNISINRWNSEHAQKRCAGMRELFSELEDCVPSPLCVERALEGSELTAFLNAWLASLPKDDRVLFVRRYWNGEALKTLEREYGQSHGKLAKRMYRLRADLRAALEKEGYSI